MADLFVDPFRLLKKIAKNPDAFSAIKSDVRTAGQKLFEKQLKHKSADLKTLRNIFQLFDESEFSLLIGEITPAPIITRLDKHHPNRSAMNVTQGRQHLIALASGKAEPAKDDKGAQKEFENWIKDKSTDIEMVRNFYNGMGAKEFTARISRLKSLKSCVTRLDKNPDCKDMVEQEYREHLISLASGKAEPLAKPVKNSKAKKVATEILAVKTKSEKSEAKKKQGETAAPGFMQSASLTMRDRERK